MAFKTRRPRGTTLGRLQILCPSAVKRSNTMRTIAFFSQAPACGKTTACVNVGAALAEMGRQVLVVDLDAQACATSLLGRPARLENSVLAALLAERPLRAVLQRTPAKHLWLAPACAELSRIEQMGAVPDPNRATPDGLLTEVALALELQDFREPFDYILLDCPNQPIFMHRLVLVACDEVIVPAGLSLQALYATTPTLQLILSAQKVRGDGLPAFLGYLLHRSGRGSIPRDMQRTLAQYQLPCFSTIRHSVLMRSLPYRRDVLERLMIFAYPNHPVAATYRQVAREVDLGIDLAGRFAAELARAPSGLTPPSRPTARQR